MNRCEECLLQLNASQDGERSAESRGELETHLAECAHCRAAAEGFEAIDAELRAAFTPRRAAAAALAERVNHEVRAMSQTAAAPVSRKGLASGESSLAEWGRTLLAAAAGFLLAVALFRGQPNQQTPAGHMVTASTTSGPPAGRLVIASGPVQMRPVDQIPFFGCPSGSPIKPASVVRTRDNSRCELSLEGGNMVRLDRNTEITLHKPDRVEVNRGRMWASTKAEKPIEIVCFGCSIKSRTPSKMTVERHPQAARLIVVEGAVDVAKGSESQQLASGQQLEVAEDKLARAESESDPLLETSWVNGMLACGPSDRSEFYQRVDALLAKVGTAKLALLYEDEIRRLGDSAVPPLVAYLKSTTDGSGDRQRLTAARIVADTAQPHRIGELIELLEDENAEVRYHVARGLERLTGRNQGLPAERWKTAATEDRDDARQKWLEWWMANSDRYAVTILRVPVWLPS